MEILMTQAVMKDRARYQARSRTLFISQNSAFMQSMLTNG